MSDRRSDQQRVPSPGAPGAALPSAVAGRVTVDAADLAAVVNAGITRQRRTHRARYAAELCARVCCGRAREPERTLCRPCLDAASARKRGRR